MLPEHKNCVNGRNNQENKKIILDPIEKLSTQQQDNNSPQNINDDDDNSTTTIINFQTQLTTTKNNHHDNINNDDNHITTLGGSTPKKNYFTTTNKIIKKKSISSTTKIHRSFGNRKNHQHQQQRHKNNRISCISFQDNFNDNQHHRRRGRRLNGLQLPLHPLQLFGWLILILFGLASFYILIPTFTIELQQPLYGLLGGLYIVHTISHLAAILIDPADCELRRIHRNDRIVPEFDRTKHSHVIENGRCHLCNIRTTSNRTKHCSVCNKCVGKFDHHCKWLNHCIGDRNYVAFLMCVVSAVIATLVILAAAIAQIVLFYINPLWLNLWYINGTYNNTIIDNNIENIIDTNTDIGISNHNQTIFSLNDSLILSTTSTTSIDDIYTNFIDDTLEIFNQTFDDDNDNSITNLTSIIAEAIVTEISNDTTSKQITINNIETTTIPTGISLHDTIFLIFTGVIGILAAITAGLLLHLCFFHIYISFLGLTTYEYIRNHRQNLATSNIPTNVPPPTSSNTTTNQSDPTLITSTSRRNSQIYFCSNLKHPNDLIINNLNTNSINNEHRPTTLHCCENSREYHQQTTSMKTIYMCSLLEESSSTTTTTNEHHHHHHQHFRNGGGDGDMENSNNDKINKNNSKTFHCCSQFQKNQITNNDVADDNKVQRKRTTSAAAATILHFSEQCTFCTFRVKTPPPTTTTITKSIESIQDKRCCLKTITKHHRWRRKWNCCTNIPDSPDVPNDIISSISSTTTTIPTNNIPNSIFYQQQQQSYNNIHNNNSNLSSVINNPTQIPSHFIKTNGNNDNQQQQQSASSRIGLKTTRPKLVRPWPVTRFRHHMLRMIGRYRRPHCRHAIGINAINIGAVKQNQIRPLVNIQQQHQQQQQNNSSGDSSDTGSIGSDSTIQSIETILPTSVIRDGIYMTGELTMPVLPPPTRRKMANPTDLDELAETLGFTYTPSAQQQQQQQRFSNTNSIYRRQRRKHFLRTRSPTLSPIHESGLSNPTSPQPCRHVVSSCAGTIVNNSCGTSGSSVIISGGNSRYGKD